MINKHFLLASIATFGLALGSCTDQFDSPVVPGNDGAVTFTAQLPAGLASRAFNDGNKATNLSYAVYKSGTEAPEVVFASGDGVAPAAVYDAASMSFKLSLNLVKGQTYDFVFWADADDAPYTFDAENQSIEINYTDVEGNDDDRDAFFTSVKKLTVTGAMQKNVELRRPFAQLNIGTDDIDVAKAAKIEHGTTTVTVSDVYGKLDLFTGVASEPVEGGVTFKAHPTTGETFPVTHADETKEYEHLSMNYILTGSVILDENVNTAQKETSDVTISFADVNGKQINEFKLSAVPFQRNYRTNIYGSLLTSQVDFTIDVVPGFWEEPGHGFEVVDVWDGEELESPVFDEKGNATVASAAQLAGLADMISKGTAFVNKTVTLDTDVDMGGNVFSLGVNGKPFSGTFDGNGHTIRNLQTTEDGVLQAQYATALFPVLWGTVKNLTISGIEVGNLANGKDGGYTYGNMVGAVAGYLYGKIENVTVDNCKIYGYGKVGGLAGMFEGNDNAGDHVVNCKVINTTIHGRYNVAEGVGLCLTGGALKMPGCEFSNNTLEAEGEWITVEPTIAVYTKTDPKPAAVLYGTFADIGSYYSTGAKYYNYQGYDDYAAMINGERHVFDGCNINDLDNPFVELPADLAPVSDTYNELYRSGDTYYVISANGLEQWNLQWKNGYINNNHILYDTTVEILADIDATGKTWQGMFISPGSNDNGAFTINGNGHTISNLTLPGGGLFGGQMQGSNTSEPSVIKDLTMKNCTSTGNYHVGIIASQVYNKLDLVNVKVIDCTISGNCNVAAMIGSTTLEGSDAHVNFTNCEVSGCTITAKGLEGCDPTGASIFLGRGLMNTNGSTSYISFTGCTENGNNCINESENVVGGSWWASAIYDNGWKDVVVHDAE